MIIQWRWWLCHLIPMRFESRFIGHQGDWFHISWWQWRWRKRYWRARTIERRRASTEAHRGTE